jgi:hypothetical protein
VTEPAGVEPPLDPADEQLIEEFASQLDAALVHIAGVDVTVGTMLRQRCAWCGAILIDIRLDRIQVPIGQDPRPATWPIGALVLVDQNLSTVVEHEDGAALPLNACTRRTEPPP